MNAELVPVAAFRMREWFWASAALPMPTLMVNCPDPAEIAPVVVIEPEPALIAPEVIAPVVIAPNVVVPPAANVQLPVRRLIVALATPSPRAMTRSSLAFAKKYEEMFGPRWKMA